MVELVQKRMDDLRSLKRQEIIAPSVGNIFDFQVVTTSSGQPIIDDSPPAGQGGRNGYFRMLAVQFELSYLNNPCYTDGVQSPVLWHKAKPITSDKMSEIRRDYYNRPTDERLYYDLRSTTTSRTIMEMINDTGSTVNRARIEYLIHPISIDRTRLLIGDIDLPLHARREVCEIAVRKYLGQIQSPSYQTALTERSIAIE